MLNVQLLLVEQIHSCFDNGQQLPTNDIIKQNNQYKTQLKSDRS